ncbi:MAG TPA: CII family transcriptional regulator [Luteimonas sp.]
MTESRQVEAAILRALADKGQSKVAEATGISETKISRFKSDGGLSLHEIAGLLSGLGLAIIDTGNTEVATIPREEFDALRVLARRALLQ